MVFSWQEVNTETVTDYVFRNFFLSKKKDGEKVFVFWQKKK